MLPTLKKVVTAADNLPLLRVRPIHSLRLACALSLWLAGAWLVLTTEFGTPTYLLGLLLHLAGLLAGFWEWTAARPISFRRLGQWLQSLTAFREWKPGEVGVRTAHFRRRTQVFRLLVRSAIRLVALLSAGCLMYNFGVLIMLRLRGQVVLAQVTSKEARVTGENSGWVSYAYAPQTRFNPQTLRPLQPEVVPAGANMDVSFWDRFRAPYSAYPNLQTGNFFAVTCLPTAPQVHHIGTLPNGVLATEGATLLLQSLLLLAYGAGPFALVERYWRRELRLARTGTLTTGTLTGSRAIRVRGRTVGFRIRYVFAPTEKGTGLTGRAYLPFTPGEPTLVGFPLTVVFDPHDPATHCPLAAFHDIVFAGLPRRILTEAGGRE